MIVEEEKESVVITVVKIIFYTFLSLYFCYHIFMGKYGVVSYKNTNTTLVDKKNLLNKKEYYMKKQKNKVERLNSDNIDLDLLEEKLKENVGMAEKDEIVLFTNDLKDI
ncbi:MAG: septum formation initiator family protein [Rickettsiales bacterium]|nr:septum formation initiator family protein [Rickettsiales bacterium]